MLLYNHRKEFVGIDEDDLNALGFNNITELRNESEDFADLFVKKPGYIHNFKNFSWIDFILHSESDESKAIIHANGTNYSCNLHVAPFHFTAEEGGFVVIIKSVRALRGAEDAQANKDLEAAGGIQATPKPVTPAPTPVTPAPAPEPSLPEIDISLDDISSSEPAEETSFDAPLDSEELELPGFEQDMSLELNEPDPLDIPEPVEIESALDTPRENEFGAPIDIDYGSSLTLDDDVMKDPEPEPVEEEALQDSLAMEAPAKEEKPMLGDYVSNAADNEHLSELVRSGDYKYDPNVAADELGLPVDLIEEFIGDFIDQAHEFHDDLFASLDAEDYDNVQVLSHKLKGVAANLRVEDAFDVLSVVNTSKDKEEVLPNLQHFYTIIARLEGKEIPQAAPAAAPQIKEPAPSVPETPADEPLDEDDNYGIGIKQPDDGPMLIDEDVTPVSEDDIYDDLLAPSSEETSLHEETPAMDDILEDDDLYDDLLSTPEPTYDEPSSPEPAAADLDDDIYDDLLGVPDTATDTPEAPDDIYDDLLGSLDEPADEEVLAAPAKSDIKTEVAPLNFDAQKSANELGIPLDIVNEFVQDFKSQVTSHQQDFDSGIAEGNIQKINRTATLLKGMSDNLRLNEISDVLKQLQSETDIDNTTTPLATLKAYADQL